MINTVKEGLEFLEMVGSPWLQLHLDTYHMNIEESDIKNQFNQLRGKSVMYTLQIMTVGL